LSPKAPRKKTAPKSTSTDISSLLPNLILIAGTFILFLPLVVHTGFYFPYIFLKSILFRAAVQVMALAYIVLAVRNPEYRPRFHRISWAVLAYFAALLISSLPGISISPWSSWWGDFERMDGVITQFHLLAYFIILSQALRRERDWLLLFATSLFCGILMGLSGLARDLRLEMFYPIARDNRTQGAAGNANFIAAHMLLNLFIAFWLGSRRDRAEVYALIAGWWLRLLAALDVFLLIWSIVADAQGRPNVIGALISQPAALLIAVSLHAIILGWFVARTVRPAGHVALGLSCVFFLYSIYRSQTRGALVGLAGSLVLFSIFYLWSGAPRKTRLAAAILMLAIIATGVLLVLNRDSAWIRNYETLHRLATVSPRDSATEVRLLAWKAGAAAIFDRPILGWGPENYKIALDRHFPPALFRDAQAEQWADRAHNLALDVSVATGILGLALHALFYALILLFLLRRWLKSRNDDDGLLLGACILAYLFQSLFTFDTVNTNGILFLLLAYICYLHTSTSGIKPQAKMKKITARTHLSWQLRAAVLLAAVMLPAAFWYAVLKPTSANRRLLQAISTSRAKDPRTGASRVVYRPATVALFEQAIGFDTTGRYESRGSFAQYALDLAQTPDVSSSQKIGLLMKAADRLEQNVRQEPVSSRHYIYAAGLINRLVSLLRPTDPALADAQARRCLDLMDAAERLSPTRPQIFFERSESCGALGLADKQVAELEKGLSLSPYSSKPNLDLLCLYIARGRSAEAARQWQKIRDLDLPVTRSDYDRIIGLYDQQKQYAQMVELYRQQLSRSPDDLEVLPRLATTYRELGEFDLARRTALRAAELSPQIKASLQEFLDSLDQKEKQGSSGKEQSSSGNPPPMAAVRPEL